MGKTSVATRCNSVVALIAVASLSLEFAAWRVYRDRSFSGRLSMRSIVFSFSRALLAMVVWTGTVHAQIVVSNLNDAGAGSLRDAIEQANAAPGSTIRFSVSGHI